MDMPFDEGLAETA